jgi:hypothetical protein
VLLIDRARVGDRPRKNDHSGYGEQGEPDLRGRLAEAGTGGFAVERDADGDRGQGVDHGCGRDDHGSGPGCVRLVQQPAAGHQQQDRLGGESEPSRYRALVENELRCRPEQRRSRPEEHGRRCGHQQAAGPAAGAQAGGSQHDSAGGDGLSGSWSDGAHR